MARIDAEDIVSRLQEQLAEVQKEEVSARQAAETRLVSLSQEYESLKDQVSPLTPALPVLPLSLPELSTEPCSYNSSNVELNQVNCPLFIASALRIIRAETVALWLTATTTAYPCIAETVTLWLTATTTA